MPLLLFDQVSFCYPHRAQNALNEVSFAVEAGQYVALCGPSGCGKSTLLRLLKTVLTPHGVFAGRVLFDGMLVAEVPLRQQAARIGFVMQNPDAQIVTDKVWHELAFGLENLGTPPDVMRSRVAEMASYFGMGEWFEKDVAELSGGQKQLLNLASVMAMAPDVLVLDEPTSQLDPIAAANFLTAVSRLNRDLGTTVLIAEHRLEEVLAAADAVIVLEHGAVVAQGPPEAVAQELWRVHSPMAEALPSPTRAFFAVTSGGAATDEAAADGDRGAAGMMAAADNVVPQETAAAMGGNAVANGAASAGDSLLGRPPLTVREGRAWLIAWLRSHAARDAASAMPVERPAASRLALQLHDVWFGYQRTAPAVLRGACLQVPEGSIYALMGANGAGKSTLLRAVCGICRPQRGTVEALGRPLRNWKPEQLFRNGVASLPQDPLSLMARDSVRADLEEMLEVGGVPRTQWDDELRRVGELCQLEGLLEAHPADLSGGELQRAALAKVLLCRPRLLLLDEPTKGLDAAFKAQLGALLHRLTQRDTTVLLVSHDVEFCAQWATEVALLFNGEVVSAAAPRAFFGGNSFYTTAISRMSRGLLEGAITAEDVARQCALP